MTEWFEQFIDVATPNMMPVLAGEVLEQYANRDFFWDVPIIPETGGTPAPDRQTDEER